MRRLPVLLGLLWLLLPVCRAAELEVPGLGELWSAAEDYGVERDTNLEHGLGNLFQDALRQGETLLKRSAQVGVQLLSVAVLCALAKGMCQQKNAMTAVDLAGALAVTALSVSNVDAMIGLGRKTIGKMSTFSDVMLPVMAALTAATGKVSAAAARQGATVLFIQLLIHIIDQLLIPLLYAYLAACCAYAAVGNEGLKKLSAILKGAVTSILTAVLLVFVGYLTLSGAISGSADAAAVKATKMAISRAVPVVGGILADAAESVLVGAGVLKGTVGVVGLLAVLAICLGPFLQLAAHYLTYKLAAALTATVADPRLSGLLDSISSAFGLVLGMTGACALLLLFSTVCTVLAVAS
jgi:stage III sporulation protein AE